MTDEQAVGGDTLASPGIGEQPEGWAAAGSAAPPPAPEPAPEAPPAGAAALLEGQRPEVLMGAAFAGAFLFAKLLKRLGD